MSSTVFWATSAEVLAVGSAGVVNSSGWKRSRKALINCFWKIFNLFRNSTVLNNERGTDWKKRWYCWPGVTRTAWKIGELQRLPFWKPLEFSLHLWSQHTFMRAPLSVQKHVALCIWLFATSRCCCAVINQFDMDSACALRLGRKCRFDLWYLKGLLESLLVNLREFLNHPGAINRLLLMIKIVYHHMCIFYLNVKHIFLLYIKICLTKSSQNWEIGSKKWQL